MTLTPIELTRPESTTDASLRRLVARVRFAARPGSHRGSHGETLVSCRIDPDDIAAAFAIARAAQRKWGRHPLKQRLAVFKRAHTIFVKNARTVADLIQVESGKNRRMAIEETCDPRW